MKPRYYQTNAVNSVFYYYHSGKTGNPVIAMPTGTGKSVVIADFIRILCQTWPTTRVLVLTHVKELIEQNYDKLMKMWPGAPAGIFSAGLGRKEVGRQITFAGIKTAINAMEYFQPDIIIVDECHLISPKEDSDYRLFVSAMKEKNPYVKVIGLTATPFRMGQGMIVEPGGIFTDICIDLTTLEEFNKFFDEGFLCRLVPQETDTQLDVTGVHQTAGDFNNRELQEAVDKEAITRAALTETLKKAGGRKKWLIFTTGIEHCEHVAKMLVTEFGISAMAVHSKSGDKVRDDAVKLFKAGKIQALVNNGVFTTGFDEPGIDLIVVLRPTNSPGLWVQILGRGTRPVWPEVFEDGTNNFHLWPPGYVISGRYDLNTIEGRLLCILEGPKQNCLVLDFAANTERLGQINNPKIPNKRKKSGDPPPTKTCEGCGTYNFCSARVCCHCGEAFPEAAVRFKKTASDKELIASSAPKEVIQQWFDVQSVDYSKFEVSPYWRKPKTGEVVQRNVPPPAIRVTYNCGIRKFFEHINIEHSGLDRTKAKQWWDASARGLPMPGSVDEALNIIATRGLQEPKKIRVWTNRPNPQVLFRDYDPEAANV